MADRRRQIAALRAKAASTTFPAEAEALRAKADELEALDPPAPRYEMVDPLTVGMVGNFFENMGGVTIRFNGMGFNAPPTQTGQPVTVTNVNGQTYTIWVE